jgi:DNA (cytosine-5)-methyltransferase 1
MTPREYANLMGASHYQLDGARTNQSLFGFGDAVAVPVVEWLAKHYLMPLATGMWLDEHQADHQQIPLFQAGGARHG